MIFNVEAKRILRFQFVDLAEDWAENCETMISMGFSAIKPWYRSRFQFCEPHEIESFERMEIEILKEYISDPRPYFPSPLFGNAAGYRSVFLDQLRAERDALLGMSLEEARKLGYVGELQTAIHPATRRAWLPGSGIHQKQDLTVMEVKAARKNDCARLTNLALKQVGGYGVHTTAEFEDLVRISRGGEHADLALHALGHDNLRNFYCDAMEAVFSPLGFALSEAYSSKVYPAFSKQINDSQSIVIGNEMFQGQDLVDSFDRLKISYSVRNKRCKGARTKTNETNHVVISIDVLLGQLISCYDRFDGLAELELAIRAHGAMYSILAVEIEKAIVRGLAEIDSKFQ
jgi:hypothetical protein